MERKDLSIDEIYALDRVQKKLPLDKNTIEKLRHLKLIEGRKPNFYISAAVAGSAGSKTDYIRMRAFNNEYYLDLIVGYLLKFGSINREEINKLLLEKLSDVLNEEQKKNKVDNLLTTIRRRKIIENKGSRKVPKWVLHEQFLSEIKAE